MAEGTRRVKPSVYFMPTAQTTSSSPARVSQIQAIREIRRVFLKVDRTPAVHRQDLAGHEGRAGEEVYRLGDVLGRAGAAERRRGDDAGALVIGELPILRPRNGARRDTVHPHRRREVDGERARERGEPRFGDAVDGVALERAVGVDVDDVDDRTLPFGEMRRRFLRDE